MFIPPLKDTPRPRSNLFNRGALTDDATRIIHRYAKELSFSEKTYGAKSRGAYLIKYIRFCNLAKCMFLPTVSTDDERLTRLQAYITELKVDLDQHFHELIYWDREPQERSRRTKISQPGTENVIYEFDTQIYNRDMAKSQDRVADLLVNLSTSANRVRGNAAYLYVVAPNDDITILNRPIRLRELITGIRLGATLVKHPMLAAKHGLAVLCAGDMWIVKDRTDQISGIIVSRASGQYRPEHQALEALREAANRNLGLPDSHIITIG